jgi:hypothetical protein
MIQKPEFNRRTIAAGIIAGAVLVSTGCANLLPDAKQKTQTPWQTYEDAQAMFEKVIPGKTRLADLKALGIEPGQTPNVAYLGHADLLRRLLPTSSFDLGTLDPGLRECMTPERPCFAYQIEQVSLDRQRYGNFWLDFFNFKRQVSVSGWQFDAVFVIKDDTVVYKHWSGKPNLHQREEERSPLGPLQGFGSSLIRR